MSSALFDQIDAAVERITRLREDLLRDVDAVDRAERLALLFKREARLWSQLYEITSLRLVWRAALAAETGARAWAGAWRRQAELDRRAASCAPIPDRGGRRVAA